MKLAQTPEASEFPFFCERAGRVLDAVAIKMYGENFLDRFKTTYGYSDSDDGYKYINGSFSNISFEISDFISMCQKSNNFIAIAEMTRVFIEMDLVEVRDSKQNEFQLGKISYYEQMEEFLRSDLWLTYVDWCDSQGKIESARSFENFFKASRDASYVYTNDFYEDQLQKILSGDHPFFSSSDFENVIPYAITLQDKEKLKFILNKHLQPGYLRINVNEDYRARYHVEEIMGALYTIDSNEIENIYKESRELLSETDLHQHILVVSQYVSKNILGLYQNVTEGIDKNSIDGESLSDGYKAYQLELLAKLLKDDQVKVSKSKRKEIEKYIVTETKKLEPKHQLEVIRNFDNRALKSELPQIIWERFNANYFRIDEMSEVVSQFKKYGTKKQTVELVNLFSERVEQLFDDLETGEENTNRHNYLGFKLQLMSLFARETGNLKLCYEVIELAYAYTEAQRGDHSVLEAAVLSTKFVIEKGNRIYAYRLATQALEFYRTLQYVGLSKTIVDHDVDLDKLAIFIPLTYETLSIYQNAYPEEDFIEYLGNNDDYLSFKPKDIITSFINIYEWISNGIDVLYTRYNNHIEKDVSFPLGLGIYLLSKNISSEINYQIKQIILRQAKKHQSLGENVIAKSYLFLLCNNLGSDIPTTDEIMRYLNSYNLGWIVDKVYPEINKSNKSSFSEN